MADTRPSGNGDAIHPQLDRDWVRAAVARYERPLVSYAAHLTGDVERAWDVVQETFARLCGEDRLTVEPRLAQWLFTVSRNLAIDARRKERRMHLLDEQQADSYAIDEPAPEEAPERDDSVSAVLRCLASLPAVQQEAVRLKFQHGLSYKEIGAVLNLTATNVGFILHTALKTVRQKLGADSPARPHL